MAKGIDIQINKVVTRFTNNLWTSFDNDFNGRIFRVTKTQGVIPEKYVSGNYKDVLLNDKKDSTCFFDVLPEEEYSGGRYTSNVWVCFSVNLKTLYPTVTTERATEYAHEDVVNQIKRVGGWEITGLVRGLSAFSEYALVKPSDNMHKFYLFRVNCDVKYPLNC